jgi:GNAT superfamily N-acetyltransferase
LSPTIRSPSACSASSIGSAKRPSGTLVHRIAVQPDHRRQEHGRHLLASLGSKLAILGPPRIVAEVPETLDAACGLFSASGYVEEARLADYVLARDAGGDAEAGRFVIPVTVDDLAANGLLGQADPQTCWERSVETITARKADIAGLAVASDERIEAYLLYLDDGEIVSLRSFVEDGGSRLRQLLALLRTRGVPSPRFSKVHPTEIATERLESLGFDRVGGHRRYAATARSA